VSGEAVADARGRAAPNARRLMIKCPDRYDSIATRDGGTNEPFDGVSRPSRPRSHRHLGECEGRSTSPCHGHEGALATDELLRRSRIYVADQVVLLESDNDGFQERASRRGEVLAMTTCHDELSV
jgi:hypothetical protein